MAESAKTPAIPMKSRSHQTLACLQWPACDANFPKLNKPTYYTFIDEPDATLLSHGFYDGAYVNTLSRLDEVFGHLISEMEKRGLTKEVNIILTSDHGNEE
ncbi:hypothetical protein OSTOST_01174, partial [Ostertagia ostertagi]